MKEKNERGEEFGKKIYGQKNEEAVGLVAAGDGVTCLGATTIPTAVTFASRRAWSSEGKMATRAEGVYVLRTA